MTIDSPPGVPGTPDRIPCLRLSEAARFLRTNRRTFMKFVRAGLVPQPAIFSAKVRLWLVADLLAAVERLRDARGPGGPSDAA
jgi:hypothetical protein